MTQTILSESTKNDAIAFNMQHFVSYFGGNRNISDSNGREIIKPSLSCLSHFLPVIHIFAYDEPKLLEKFPNGIVTETFILIPTEKMNTLREDFSSVVKSNSSSQFRPPFNLVNNTHQYAFFFAKPIIESLELNLNVQLSEVEKNQISEDLNKLYKNQIVGSLNNVSTSAYTAILDDDWAYSLNATVIKNSDLLSQLDNKDLTLVEVLEQFQSLNLNEREKYLTTLLKQSNFFQFPTIQKALDNSATIEIDSTISLEKFKELTPSLFNDSQVLLIVIKKFDDMKENFDFKDPNDFTSFIKKSEETLFPFLNATNDFVFQIALSHICKEIFPVTSTTNEHNKYHDFRNLLSKAIYSNEDCNSSKRNILIDVISSHDTFKLLSLEDDKEVLTANLSKNKIKPKK